jgi:hypothetical protein
VRQYLLMSLQMFCTMKIWVWSSISTWRFCKCYDECKATPSIRVKYAYDYNTSSLGEFNLGTHEIFVLFNLDLSSRGYDKSPIFLRHKLWKKYTCYYWYFPSNYYRLKTTI